MDRAAVSSGISGYEQAQRDGAPPLCTEPRRRTLAQHCLLSSLPDGRSRPAPPFHCLPALPSHCSLCS